MLYFERFGSVLSHPQQSNTWICYIFIRSSVTRDEVCLERSVFQGQ